MKKKQYRKLTQLIYNALTDIEVELAMLNEALKPTVPGVQPVKEKQDDNR